MHHTKEKGDFGNLKIMTDLGKQGFKILTPLSEHLPFDLVIFDPLTGKLFKVQSKYKAFYKGIISVPLISHYSDSKKVVSTRYPDGAFDVLAVYCPDIDKVFYEVETNLRELSNSVNFSINPHRGKRFVNNYTDLRKLLKKISITI